MLVLHKITVSFSSLNLIYHVNDKKDFVVLCTNFVVWIIHNICILLLGMHIICGFM